MRVRVGSDSDRVPVRGQVLGEGGLERGGANSTGTQVNDLGLVGGITLEESDGQASGGGRGSEFPLDSDGSTCVPDGVGDGDGGVSLGGDLGHGGANEGGGDSKDRETHVEICRC